MSGTMIMVEDLVRKFGSGKNVVTAVNGVNLFVAEGEIFGLLGPNGAGKSTTIGVMTTRVKPTSGHVEVAGIDVLKEPTRARKAIGVSTQANSLDRSCTTRENLYYHCRYSGMRRQAAAARADELLEQAQLTERAGVRPVALSGGMAQRLQVARAIAHRPAVLFLDEPTAGLDPQSRIALWDLIRQLRADGVTVLLTTHYMDEADALCDTLAIIDHGTVLTTGSPDSLKQGLGADVIVRLSVDRDPDGLCRQLAGQPQVQRAEIEDGAVAAYSKGGHGAVPGLIEAAVPHGLRDVRITEPTLENVFINLTGRQFRD